MTKLSKTFNCLTLRKKTYTRIKILVIVMLALIAINITQLIKLQIYQHNEFKLLSTNNRVSYIPLPPTRGQILDRNGNPLVTNAPIWNLEIIPNQTKNISHLIDKIKTYIQLEPAEIANFYKMKNYKRNFHPVPVKLNLTEIEIAKITSNLQHLTGAHITTTLKRKYIHDSILTHTLGYIGLINSDEIKKLDKSNYAATAFTGKNGVEKQYESLLHGTVGYKKIEINAYDRITNIIDEKPPLAGNDIYLTIDLIIQKAAEEAMQSHRGAAIAIDTRSGGILAIISTPGYSLSQLNDTSNGFKQILQQPHQPMFNRCLSGLYPIASTIKPIIALQGLDKDIITTKYCINDPGWFKLPNSSHVFKDWKWRSGGQGWINLEKALIHSNDTYFYNLANLMGIDMIHDILNKFGFGRKTHIDLPNESCGLLPSPEWKQKNKNEPWYSGDTCLTGIGQGFFLATPLQLANATLILANRGEYPQIHILEAISSNLHNKPKQHYSSKRFSLEVGKTNIWDPIISSMRQVTNKGTGWRFGTDVNYSIAAKTGTGQVVSTKINERYINTEIPEMLRDHSLFIAFAPVDKPKIAIAVIIENNPSAPVIARKILDSYFNNNS